MKSTFLSHAITALVAITASVAICFAHLNQVQERNARFVTVDFQQLSKAQITKLQNSLANQTNLTPIAIELLGKEAASKMIQAIMDEVQPGEIVLPKNVVLYAPASTEITERVAARLQLEGVKANTYEKAVSAMTSDHAAKE